MTSQEMMRCLNCSYNLRGLPENRCPECGQPFNPEDPETYQSRPHSGLGLLWNSLLSVLLLVLTLAAAQFVDARVTLIPLFLWVLWSAMMVWAFTLAWVVTRQSVAALRQPRELLARRRAAIAALLISLLVFCALAAALIIPAFSRVRVSGSSIQP